MSLCNLHESILNGDYDAVVNCSSLQTEIDEPYWKGDGKTPILIAAVCGNVDIIRLLCENGCNVNARTIHGKTALHLCISNKKNIYKCLDILLTNGCDANIHENLQGQTPLHSFTMYMIKSEDYSELAIETLRKIVENCNPNIVDHRQRSALHRAAYSLARINCIEILLACDPNLRNNRGETALHEALETDNCLEVIKLIASKTDLSLANCYGETPLHVAARKRQCQILKYLTSIGANINVKDVKGNTPLHLAAERGYEDALKILTSWNGTEVNAQNYEGLTPLHVAVESGFQTCVELLLKAETCDVNVKTKESQTALDLAQQEYRRRSQPELCDMLFIEFQRRQSDKFI